MLIPYQDLSRAQIEQLKVATKRELVRRAAKELNVKPKALIIRDLMWGDSDGTLGNGFVDMGFDADQTANGVFWGQDATSFGTANDYDDISITTGTFSEVQDGRFYGFYGAGELQNKGGVLTGPQTGTMPSMGSILGVKFKTGGKTKDLWNTETLYGRGIDVSGFSFDVNPNGELKPSPVIYEENNPITVQMMSSEVTLDKFFALRGYVVEKWTNRVSATPFTQNDRWASDLTTDPAAELTSFQKSELFRRTLHTLYELGKVKFKLWSNLSHRPFIIADESDATERTHVDVDNRTAATTGIESYAQDATDLTTMILSSVVNDGEEIDDGKWSGIWGFTDRTPNPDLHYMALLWGENRIGINHVETCYLYHEEAGGFFRTPYIFPENTPIDWQIACRLATADKFISLNAATVEKKGKVIS
jgi:hypothetical protein